MVSLLKSLVDPRKNWFPRQHMKVVSQRLCHYGRLYDPYYDLDINKALSRLSREIVDARNQSRALSSRDEGGRCILIGCIGRQDHPYLRRSQGHPSVGAEADDDRIQLLLSEVKGNNITELIASGREKSPYQLVEVVQLQLMQLVMVVVLSLPLLQLRQKKEEKKIIISGEKKRKGKK
ncbi:hypothetical protein C1H46_040176 [Malus baccata]|uniref:Uncharacterized protein n=1 Tax=Malus baccata TaxID=106549 RepID=A0A540KJC7_MALBA|nr:hypothetical protein C1H46_040176 [Malus baccata]